MRTGITRGDESSNEISVLIAFLSLGRRPTISAGDNDEQSFQCMTLASTTPSKTIEFCANSESAHQRNRKRDARSRWVQVRGYSGSSGEDFNMEMGSDDEHIRSSSNISGQSMDEEKDNNAIPEYNYEYTPSSDNNSLSNEQLERIQKIENATSKVRRVIEKYGNAPLPSLDPKDANGSWEIDADSAWSDPSVAVAEIVSAREELKSAWGDGENGGADEGGEGQQKQEWWKSILGDETSKSNNSGEAKKHVDTKTEGDDEPLTKAEEEQFDAVYLEWTTNAFAEELEALRRGQLENLTSSKKQKKSAAAASGSAEVDLDPTQYSFIVASKGGKGKGIADDETATAAVAAEEIDVQVLADMLQSGGNFLSATEKKMLLRARQRAKMRSDEKDPFVGLSLHERRRRELGFVVER